MRDDQRKRIRILRTCMNEMNIEPVDVRRKLRQDVQPRFDLAPVVIRLPIAREFTHRRELHSLSGIRYRFPLGPPRRADPPAEVNNRRFGKVDLKGTDRLVTIWGSLRRIRAVK